MSARTVHVTKDRLEEIAFCHRAERCEISLGGTHPTLTRGGITYVADIDVEPRGFEPEFDESAIVTAERDEAAALKVAEQDLVDVDIPGPDEW